MTTPEVETWAESDPVWYRTFGPEPRAGEVVAVWPGCVEVWVYSTAGTFYAFPDELTRREP